jgi:acetyl esterase/lipase
MVPRLLRCLLALAVLALAIHPAQAGPLRDWLQAHAGEEDDSGEADNRASLPADTRVLRDIAYGGDALQRMDVYLPPRAAGAPVIVMVHGGGWHRGDKDSAAVVDNKAARWLPQGFIFVSVNYRLLPDTAVDRQADDVARALARIQQQAAGWGGDTEKIVLMGHSAGAHLVSLLAGDLCRLEAAGARRWLGTVVLDSAAIDVEGVMQRRHLPLYDRAFGKDREYWRAVSPLRQLTARAAPLLLVCSSTRRDRPCDQAEAFAARAATLDVPVEVVPVALSHRAINRDLGRSGAYTQRVEHFMAALDPALAQRLGAR